MSQGNKRHQATLASAMSGAASRLRRRGAWGSIIGSGRGTSAGQAVASGQLAENHQSARSLRFRVGDE